MLFAWLMSKLKADGQTTTFTSYAGEVSLDAIRSILFGQAFRSEHSICVGHALKSTVRADAQKERGETFLESLLSACREWFNERDKLLRPEVQLQGGASPRRWTAYVCFLAELLLGLRGRNGSGGAAGTGGRTASRTLCLLMLLCDCCHIILRPPSLCNPTEASIPMRAPRRP